MFLVTKHRFLSCELLVSRESRVNIRKSMHPDHMDTLLHYLNW